MEVFMRAHNLLTLTMFVGAITGCSMGETHSNGARTLTLDCSGLGKGFDDCEQKAAAQCGTKGFDVVSRTGDSVNNEMKRTMVVSCK
jgi:hypothetical protein